MLVIQTEIDHRAMTALARANRKTLRRGQSGPVRALAWFVVALELFLTVTYVRGGETDWPVNALLGLFMLGCLLLEDRIGGAAALRRIPPDRRTVNATFQGDSSSYVHRTRAGESWQLYSQLRAAVETEDYFILLQDRRHGQVYDKKGFSWGTPQEFRELIHKKTGLKIEKIR